ncbi:MAG: hypothetical protein M1819_001568 [Sarea resinae]|nr:MAG: hypothetical protein M1819_001568 [Sarea resinae]
MSPDSGFNHAESKEASLTSKGLNKTLTRFYLESGRVSTAEDWFDKNPYDEALSDDQEEWMDL